MLKDGTGKQYTLHMISWGQVPKMNVHSCHGPFPIAMTLKKSVPLSWGRGRFVAYAITTVPHF
jgi:hypothetical protein